MSDKFLYYRDLFNIFDAYTSPKLKRVMDSQNVAYILDSKGRPMTTRAAIDKALGMSTEETPDEFPGFQA
jgi:hypothetical protein